MTITFTPPSVSAVPPTLPEDHPGNRLMRFFRARPEGVNVYLYKAGSLSAAAHGRVTEDDPIALYDSNGVSTTNGWEDIEVVFWGGCLPVTITAEWASLLQAAGYTVTTGPSVAPPVITSLSPASGIGGTVVTINGTGLDSTTTVTVDNVSVTFSATTTTITFTTPTHTDGAADVVVTTPHGVAQTTFTYLTPGVNDPPAITALSPTSGIAGVAVTISGTNFAAATSVTFDGVSASFTINSATQISATAPSHADGAISVVVTDANGASNGSTFTYATPPAPVITSVSPSSGVATTLVTLTGTTFSGATSVTVDGVSVAFTQVSATQVTFVAPTHVDGAVTIVLTTPYGSDSDTFTYATPAPSAPPVLTTLTPSSGSTAGGTSVVIAGTSLDITTQLTWDGTPISFTVNSPTQITTTSPAHAAGTVNVIAVSGNGPSNTLTFVHADADPHPGTDILSEDGSFILAEDGSSTIQAEG